MKTRLFNKIICLLAVVMTLSFGMLFATNLPVAKAETSTDIVVEGASVRYVEPYGLRFKATMQNSKFSEMALADDDFEVGMLIIPDIILGDGDLTVETSDVNKVVIHGKDEQGNSLRNSFLEDHTVVFKAYLYNIPVSNLNTEIVGRAYFRYNGTYYYSNTCTRTMVDVAKLCYNDVNTDDDTKTILYNSFLEPYYAANSNFNITAVAGCANPSIYNDLDQTKGAVTVSMPKNPDSDNNYHNAMQSKNSYAPGTYVMMEFMGGEIPGFILFGATGGLSTGGQGSGVGFWLDEASGVSACIGSPYNPRAKQTSGNLNRTYLTSQATTKYLLIAGAETNASDSTKTDLNYYLYTLNGEVYTLFESGSLTGVDYTLTEGKIELRAMQNGSVDIAKVKVYTPDTYANLITKLNSIYFADDAAEKFTKSAAAKVSTNSDRTYQINMPIAEYNYVATTATYAPGTYFMAEMKGKDIPGMVIFDVDNAADTIVTKNSTNGDGIVKQNTWNGVGIYTEYVWNTEVYSKQAGSDAVYTLAGGKFNTHNTDGVVSLGEQEVVLVMGAYNEGTDTKVHYIIYAKDGENLTKYDEMTYTISGMNVGTGSILFASKHRAGGIPNVDIKLWAIGSKTEVETKLNAEYNVKLSVAELFSNKGATVNENNDGSYQMSMSLLSGGEYNYVATKQTYGAGTYFMAEFVGNKMPGMVLFGVDNVNDATTFTDKANFWNGVGLYTDDMWNTYSYNNGAYTAVGGIFNRHDDATRGMLTDKTYVMFAGVYQDGADTKIEYIISEKIDDSNVTVLSRMTYTFASTTIAEGSIVFTSTHVRGAETTMYTDIKLYAIGDKDTVNAKLNETYVVTDPT